MIGKTTDILEQCSLW